MVAVLGVGAAGCAEEVTGKDPRTAERAPIDRFSAAAGTLMVRTAANGLPGPNEAIDVDARFVVRGLGPAGQRVTMYEFDVKPRAPAPIYVFFAEGKSSPVKGQKNVVTVIPGDAGYNDLWQVVRVAVPADYVANSVTSFDEIEAAGHALTVTDELVNCPVVPEGSVARVRLAADDYVELTQGWYGGRIIQYFHFGERRLVAAGGQVPASSIYVAYAVNPGEPGGGVEAGYAVESGSAQTHNVVAAVPADASYSPLWSVNVYDQAAFAGVTDLATAMAARRLESDARIVNAPIVAIE